MEEIENVVGRGEVAVGVGSDETTTSVLSCKVANTRSTSCTNFLLSFLTTSFPSLSSPSALMRSFSRWWATMVGVEAEVDEERRKWS